jgi:hypothetical protein
VEQDEAVKRFHAGVRASANTRRPFWAWSCALYHDQALYKEPAAGFTRACHQFSIYWPLPSNTLTLWMPLIDITEDMACLRLPPFRTGRALWTRCYFR